LLAYPLLKLTKVLKNHLLNNIKLLTLYIVAKSLLRQMTNRINAIFAQNILYMKNIFLLLLIVPALLVAQSDDKLLIKKGIDTEKYVPKGLKVADEAPKIIALSLSGEKINSEELLKEKEIVVIFYRGEWCPICNRYLNNLNDSLSYILDKNVEILVVGPQTNENTQKTKDKTEGSFTLIPDTSMQIMQNFDVLFNVTKKYQGKIKTFLFTDIAESNNQDEAKLPVPATYIIGKDGKIKWRHFDYDYSKRASVKAILDHLN